MYFEVSNLEKGFPGGSYCKDPAFNAGNSGSIPGWRKSLKKGMATHSSVLAWEFHGQRSLVGYSPWDHKEWDTTEQLTQAKLRKGTHGILLVANDNHEFRHFQGNFHFHLGFSLSLSLFSLVETRRFLYVGLKVENTLLGGWTHITSHFQNQRKMRVLPFCSY